MRKKILGILLSIGLVLTMVPATVFADGETIISEVNLTIEKNFDSKTMIITPAEGEKGYYDESELKSFGIFLIDKEGNYAYGYQDDGEGNTGWTDGEDDIEETDVDMGNIDFIIWYHYLTTKGEDYKFAANVVPKVNGETLNAVTKNEDEIAISTGYDLDTSDYEGLTIYIREDLPDVSSGSLVIETEESKTVDLEVDYTYLPESNTAEKVFNVTVDYTFPATLDAKGAQNTYTWSPTDGKYTLDTDSSTAESYTLSNEGAFSIKLTNQSNVDINYEVSYAANDEAVFASALNGSMTNDKATLATVAKGQEVTEDGINITNATNATAAMADGDTFNSETCTGKLKVTGINSGKTPDASGSDTLGTFTINIAEAEPEDDSITLGEMCDSISYIPHSYENAITSDNENYAKVKCWIDDSEGSLCFESLASGHENEIYKCPLNTTLYLDKYGYTTNLEWDVLYVAFYEGADCEYDMEYQNDSHGIESAYYTFTEYPLS